MYATFTLELANHTKRDGTKAIYIRVTISKKHHRFPLHLYVKPENFENGKVSRADIGAMAKNIRIEQLMAKANKIKEDFYLRYKRLTMEDFIAEFSNDHYGSQSFYDYANSEIPLMAVTRSPQTMKCYTTLINNLKKFRPHLNLGDINLNFFRLYERHFIEGGIGGQQTAHKNLKYLKCMMNRAQLTGLIRDTSYQQFKIKQFEGHREFLDPEELEILKDLYWKQTLSPAYNSALQYFLFSCYTGLRYHDLKVLTFKNIIETRDEKGLPRKAIRMMQHKTKYLVTIPLVAEAVRLLPERGFDEQPVFKVIVNQYLNRILEKIILEAKIPKTITMHCARHTFATVALVKGIRIDFVSKFLGHKNLKVTAIYAKYIDPTLIQEMRKWDAV